MNKTIGKKLTGRILTTPRPASGATAPLPDPAAWTGLALRPREFARIRDMLYNTSGIDLRDGKEQLVASRMAKYLRSKGHKDIAEFLSHLEGDHTGESLLGMIDVLTTNHTSFLREPDHFQFLRAKVAPWLSARPIRVWCAASSTGEEPYSILFTLLDALGAAPASVEMLATDISRRVLEAARRGIYPAERLQGVPAEWKQRYFARGEGASAGQVKVKPQYGGRIEFKRFNLMESPPSGWRFPVIFCRNVMIYFNRATQTEVVNRLASVLEPGGYLFVGHAESLTGIEHSLQYIQPAIYRKPGGDRTERKA